MTQAIATTVPETRQRDRSTVVLIVCQLIALACQAAAVVLARLEHRVVGEVFSDSGLAFAYASSLWTLTRPQLSRRTRNVAVLCLGLTPTLMWRFTNPLLFTGFDEQLHMRTIGDIISSHTMFQANPLLEVSPRYPGLEAITMVLFQIGIPVQAAATIVILVARIVLVTVLCDAAEQLTGSPRGGGLAVAVYALSPQFVFFNSQYSYQTVAIPLALGAVSLIARTPIPRPATAFRRRHDMSARRRDEPPRHQFCDHGLSYPVDPL